MNTTEQILLLILSGALAVFLILGIVAIIKTIQILNVVKQITVKAEMIADRAESVSEMFEKTAGPIAIARLFANISEAVKRHKK